MPLTEDEELLKLLRMPAEEVAKVEAAAARAAQAAKPKRRVTEPFVIIELEQLKAAYRAVADMGAGALVVWELIVYEARLKRTNTVSVSNLKLAKWGITRPQKSRTLERLEAAGLVELT